MKQMMQGRELRKFIADLDDAKGRRRLKAWKAEGTKCTGDLLGLFPCRIVVATEEWLDTNRHLSSQAVTIVAASPREMERMSRLKSPAPVIAVFDMPETSLPAPASRELILALDTVQDPGNLGTIIRTADWMGVRHILATRTTADCFAPKVVMATMGALARVSVHYLDDMAAELKGRREAGAEILGTFLDGTDMFATPLPTAGDGCIVVMGNEGRGISAEIGNTVTRRLLIPAYPPGASTSESLNVATATAITLARLRFGGLAPKG